MKQEQLQSIVNEIGTELNRATSYEQAIQLGQKSYLFLDNTSAYGGYRLVAVKVEGGAHLGALGMSATDGRRKAAEMYAMLEGILIGIMAAKPVESI